MPPNKISRVVFWFWAVLVALIIVLAVFLAIHFRNTHNQIPQNPNVVQASQAAVSQAIKTQVVTPIATSTLAAGAFPAILNFLIPSSAQDLQEVSAQYPNNEKGFEVGFALSGSLQGNFFSYNDAVRLSTGWQDGPTAYSSNFALMSGSLKNYAIQAKMIPNGSNTSVILEIIAN